MTALQLHKFIEDNGIEWRWETNESGEDDVIIFPYSFQMHDFNEIMKGSGVLDDGGVICYMRNGYFALFIKDICDYFGIDMEEVFKKE